MQQNMTWQGMQCGLLLQRCSAQWKPTHSRSSATPQPHQLLQPLQQAAHPVGKVDVDWQAEEVQQAAVQPQAVDGTFLQAAACRVG